MMIKVKSGKKMRYLANGLQGNYIAFRESLSKAFQPRSASIATISLFTSTMYWEQTFINGSIPSVSKKPSRSSFTTRA